MDRYCIKDGYRARLTTLSTLPAKDEWQNEVYGKARALAELHDSLSILDIGSAAQDTSC